MLEIRNNKLRKFKGFINMRNLKELYACDNEITDIRGFENVNSLVKLSVRKNKIKNILAPFPHFPSLTHLNMR
jgi:Leucine-rich repeat (LRR) protein